MSKRIKTAANFGWALWASLLVGLLLVVPNPGHGGGSPGDGPSEEQFKYGSIGTEIQQGIPYWVWLVLPRVFADKLPGPGGYSSLGMVWEEGQELPVGFTKQTFEIPRVGLNCASCHTSSYRRSEQDARPTIVTGGASPTFDAQSYLRFLFDCASDSRFTADVILPEIEKVYPLSWLQQLLYEYVIIPRTRRAILESKRLYGWMDSRPPWGPGRVDPFNPIKFNILGLPEDATIGQSDIIPLWGMKERLDGAFHWDGLNPLLREGVIFSAIGDGSPPQVIDRPEVLERLYAVQSFIREIPTPKYPFEIKMDLLGQGKQVYDRHCASCHGTRGQGQLGIIPVDEIGTDPERWKMWTERAAQACNEYTEDHSWAVQAFRKTPGYLSVPLTGLWLRAPYLHNGSVPTLRDLLEPPGKRPMSFYRGNDVYDAEKLGFVSDKSEVKRGGVVHTLFSYDTRLPGNSNVGHLYGVDLSVREKNALMEFLKTL